MEAFKILNYQVHNNINNNNHNNQNELFIISKKYFINWLLFYLT